MASAEHALQLQFLLRKLHSKTPSNGDPESNSQSAAANLIRFIYFQCFPTIQQRLCLPVRHGGPPFKDLFSVGRITASQLRSSFDKSAINDLVLDEKILLHGDEWIVEYWKACWHGKEPNLDTCNDHKYLVYDAETAVGLHKVIRVMFKKLSNNLERVHSARLVHTKSASVTAEYLECVEAALDSVDYYMAFLASLVQSPCFWRHLRRPAVQEWVLKEASNNQNPTGKVCAQHVPQCVA